MPDITDKTTLADAEQEALTGYERGAVLPTEKVVAPTPPVAPTKPEPIKEQTSASSAAEATKTAGALLDAWFASAIHNSEYSRDSARYNSIQKQYRALRALIT